MVNVIDFFQLRIALLDDLVEAHRAHAGKGWLQGGKALHVGVRTHVLVMVEANTAHLILHRDDRLGEAALFPGARGALLAFNGERIDIIAREAPLGGNRVSANALRRKVGLQRDLRIS